MTRESATAMHHETSGGKPIDCRLIASNLPRMSLISSPLVVHTLRDFRAPLGDLLSEETGTEVVFVLRDPPVQVRVRSWGEPPEEDWPDGVAHLEVVVTWTGSTRALSVQGSPHGEVGWLLASLLEDIDRLLGRGDFEDWVTLAS